MWQGAPEAWPGLAIAIGIAILVHLALRSVPLVPDVVGAIVIGAVVGNAGLRARTASGAHLVVRYGLRLAIIALGAGLNFAVVADRGWSTLLLIVVLVVIAMTLGLLLGRAAHLGRTVSVLLGVGSAICGASAILAVSPLVNARQRETAYAITTIFVFNLVALLTLPYIGHALGFGQTRFGTWVGTSVNDTSVVVATGYVFGPTAGAVATLVKLTRTMLLVPLSIFVGTVYGDSGQDRQSIVRRAAANMPWFVLGFFLMALLNTMHIVPPAIAQGIAQGGTLLLVVVLAAVGLGVNFAGIRQMGVKPLLIGFLLGVAMVIISISLITLLQI